MTKEDVLAFSERWAAVNAAEQEEGRRTPISTKLRQLSTLMASGRSFGWKGETEVEDKQARERWLLLKRRSGV